MPFKLGYKRLPGIARNGNIVKKHDFTIKHAKLDDNVVAEAINGHEIVIDKNIPKDSDLYREAVAHEAVHAKEMREGRIAYNDDYLRDGDEIYERKDGKIKYNGNWYVEGSDKLPWEQRAIAAEKYA